jgi:hypothetical protein
MNYKRILDLGCAETGEMRVTVWDDNSIDLTVYNSGKSARADMTVERVKTLIAALQNAIAATEA